jgi:hypothetical protein
MVHQGYQDPKADQAHKGCKAYRDAKGGRARQVEVVVKANLGRTGKMENREQ